jgi:hypothetical protein
LTAIRTARSMMRRTIDLLRRWLLDG